MANAERNIYEMNGADGSSEIPQVSQEDAAWSAKELEDKARASDESALAHTGKEEESSVNAAGEYLSHAVDERQAVDEKDQYDLTVAYKMLNPDRALTDAQKEKLIDDHTYIKNIVGDHKTLEPHDVIEIANRLNADTGIRKDHESTDKILELYFPTLTPETRNEIKERLNVMASGERPENDNISNDEADNMFAKANAMKELAETQAQQLEEEINANGDLNPEEKTRRIGLIQGKLKYITDWFAPGEPGRDWARRIGKTLYITLVIIFLFYIWEMNVINKVGGRK